MIPGQYDFKCIYGIHNCQNYNSWCCWHKIHFSLVNLKLAGTVRNHYSKMRVTTFNACNAQQVWRGNMSIVTEEDFEKFVSEIGYPDLKKKWKWLIDYQPTGNFVKWICEDVNLSNYLSDEELNEYIKIEDSGLALEGEELENAVYEKIPEYFESSVVDSDYISALKDELQYVQNHSRLLADWAEKQQNEVLAAQREVSDLENKTVSQRKKLVNAQSDCLAKSSLLESSMQQLTSNLVNLKKYCLDSGQDVSNSRFLSEIPLLDYIEESSAFSRELNVEQVISSADLKRNSNVSSMDNFSTKLKKAKKGLQDVLLLKVEETARRKGLESACELVQRVLQSRRLWEFSSNCSSVIETLAEQKQNLWRMEARIKQSAPVETRVEGSNVERFGKLGEVITKCVERQCCNLEDLQKELLFHQKREVCDRLQKLEEELKNQCATDMVWLFLLGEEVTEILNLFELAKSGEEFLMREQQDRILRIESMKNVTEGRNHEIGKTETWCLMNVLSSYLKTSQHIISKSSHHSAYSWLASPHDISYSLKLLAESIEKYENDNLERELLMMERSESTVTALMTRCKELANLKRFICNGSTENCPVIWPVKQLMFCFASNSFSKKLKKRIRKLTDAYQGEMQKSTAQEELTRSLWKKFIISPKEVKAMVNSLHNPLVMLNDELMPLE